MIIDLHVHTTRGASDSSLTPQELVAEAKRVGLDAVCLTEHGRLWQSSEFDEFARQHNLHIFRGMEIETELGHIVVFGLNGYVSGIHQAQELKRVAEAAGAFLIAVHPFRHLFDRVSANRDYLRTLSLEAACQIPLFEMVHEIEVTNGGCTDAENFFALQVAKRLGLRGTGGSDAHSIHGLGCCTTIFEAEIRNEAELLHELKAGRFYPAQGLLDGELTAYGGGLTELDLGSRP